MTYRSLTASFAPFVPRLRGNLCAIALALAIAGWPAPSAAQLAGDEAETPRYTVELIVFLYADDDTAGNEVFRPEPRRDEVTGSEPSAGGGESPPERPEPVFDDRSLPAAGADGGDAEAGGPGPRDSSPGPAIELHRLEPEAFTMTDALRKLEQLDAYRPILHTAWTQTTHDKAQSPTLPLRALGDPPPGLDGNVTLYQSRFLHLDVDLSLDAGRAEPAPARSATDRLVRGSEPPAPADGDPFLPPVRYRISEDRIMRDGDIRYFDHPRFGMLARVTRLTPAASEAAVRAPLDPGARP